MTDALVERVNVSPRVWRRMCERSYDLGRKARFYTAQGMHSSAAKVWQELRPLNRRIRKLGELPADGSEPVYLRAAQALKLGRKGDV